MNEIEHKILSNGIEAKFLFTIDNEEEFINKRIDFCDNTCFQGDTYEENQDEGFKVILVGYPDKLSQLKQTINNLPDYILCLSIYVGDDMIFNDGRFLI